MYRNWASDPEVTRYLLWPAHESEEETKGILKGWIAAYEKPEKYEWCIELKEIGEAIGSIGVVMVNEKVQSMEVGYCLSCDYWHKGIMSEALSAVVEYLTNELIRKGWAHLQEVEKLGGMAKAIETGLPKMRIEEAAARRQAAIDSGKEPIIGVNKYRLEQEAQIDILEVDNTTVREAQIARLQERDSAACEAALEALSECARTGEGNLLDLAIKAAKARASLGEISSALEKHFGRHKAPIKLITGVYAQSYGQDPLVEEVRKMTDDFAERTGRRPRILVAKMGQDGHDRGAKVVSSAYADLGFDVDVGPLFQTPEETAKMAIENDVHMIGMSSLAAGHKVLLPALVEELAKQGRPDILVFCGGVIPAQDYDFLKENGVVVIIFGPGTNIPEASREIMEALNEQYAE